MSQVYPVKSNAARAAKKFGLTRSDLFCVPGGWTFETPEEKAATNKEAFALPVATAEPVQAAAPLTPYQRELALQRADRPAKARAKPFSGPRAVPTPAPAEPKATEPAPVKTKRPNGKATKAAKPATVKRSRQSGANTGVCNQVIGAIKSRWTSIDDLMKLSGWQRHTLRGYISTRASKDGFTVERRKVEGVSQYRIAA